MSPLTIKPTQLLLFLPFQLQLISCWFVLFKFFGRIFLCKVLMLEDSIVSLEFFYGLQVEELAKSVSAFKREITFLKTTFESDQFLYARIWVVQLELRRCHNKFHAMKRVSDVHKAILPFLHCHSTKVKPTVIGFKPHPMNCHLLFILKAGRIQDYIFKFGWHSQQLGKVFNSRIKTGKRNACTV